MRLVSFNVQHITGEDPRHRQMRMQAAAAFMLAQQPDIICLQEITPPALEILNANFPEAPVHYSPRIQDAASAEGVPVWVLNPEFQILDQGHFWFSNTPEVSSRSWKSAHPRICSWLKFDRPASAPLWLFNLHLDHRSAYARRQSLELLHRKIHSEVSAGDHILVCGDFNMSGARREIRALSKRNPGLQDATLNHPLGFLRPTYLGWGPFRLAKARIDLCLHSRNLTVPEYHALDPEWNGIPLSDHRALRLTIREQN